MGIAPWITSGILAAAYLAAGLMMTFTPKEKLTGSLPWVEDYSPATIKLIGIAEGLGATSCHG